jgi:hypothetical protein
MSRIRFVLQLAVLMACLLLALGRASRTKPIASSTSSSNSYSSTGKDSYTGEDYAYASTGTYTKTVAANGGSASAYSDADALAGGECTTVGHCYDKGTFSTPSRRKPKHHFLTCSHCILVIQLIWILTAFYGSGYAGYCKEWICKKNKCVLVDADYYGC